jgi:hypothetical protein
MTKKRGPKKKDNKPKDLGGWLILVTITVSLLSLMYILFALIQIIDLILGKINIETIFLLIFSIVFSVLFSYCFYLELKHRKEFPTWFMSSLWAGSILSIILGQIYNYPSSTPFNIISTVIWTWYFIKSKRVKNTFIK